MFAQVRGEVVGFVRDGEGRAVVRAGVELPSLGLSTWTDGEGRFVLRSVPSGRHPLRVVSVGYAPERLDVEVPSGGGAVFVEVSLRATPLVLPGLSVTAVPGRGDPEAVVQATTVLSGEALERELGGTVAETLRGQPGVAVRSQGPAAAMPVLRGLTGDRVLLLQDGQRSGDLAGSADDHGVTIDPLSAQRIEVVRGPATLLYGNNALGGVVNVVSGDLLSHRPDRLEGVFALQSETAQPGGSGSFRAVLPLSGPWVFLARGGVRRVGDQRIPEDPALGRRLTNTQSRSWNGAVGFGHIGDRLVASGAVRGYDFRYGIPQPPGAPPVQLDGSRREALGRVEFRTGRALLPRLQLDATVQDYRHDELDAASSGPLQTFALETWTVNLLVYQGEVGRLTEGAWGVSVLGKHYAAKGPSALTPPADSRGVGVFGFQEIALVRDGPTLQLGGRLDGYRIASRTSPGFGPGRERAYRAWSGSVGLRVPILEGGSTGLSVARSFRAPTVEELYSGAFHAGTGAMEYGSPTLEAERGIAVEAIFRVRRDRWTGQATVYRNRIENYVHLAARGDTVLHGARIPVLAYAQDRATLQGIEGSVEWQLGDALVVGAMGDLVRAERADGTPLSYMPPPRLGAQVRWDDGTLSVGADVHHEFRQDRIGEADEMPTPAHTMLRVHAGYRFRAGRQLHSIGLRIDNLRNSPHREATSRIKDFAPGPGRNLAVTYRILF